jgi:disease resistance protein RPM1
MEHLDWIEIEDGTMIGLHHLELVGLGNVKAVPAGIQYLRKLHQMFLTDMSKGFIQRLQGSDNYIVQHIPNIHIFYSSDSQAGNCQLLDETTSLVGIRYFHKLRLGKIKFK